MLGNDIENSHRKFRATDRPRTRRNETSEEQRPDGILAKDRSVVDCWPKSLRLRASQCNAGPLIADEVG